MLYQLYNSDTGEVEDIRDMTKVEADGLNSVNRLAKLVSRWLVKSDKEK